MPRARSIRFFRCIRSTLLEFGQCNTARSQGVFRIRDRKLFILKPSEQDMMEIPT
jgi:hypothetical protein